MGLFFVWVALQAQVDCAAAGKPVKIGVYNNAPLIFIDAQGRASGFFADIIDYVATSFDSVGSTRCLHAVLAPRLARTGSPAF